MARSGLTWTITPSAQIGAKLARAASAAPGLFEPLAASYASRGEGQMRGQAPWTDRTGYARSALFGAADGTDVVLGTTNAEYGPYLELGTSKMAARPVIVPVATELAPQYFEDCGTLAMQILGGN